MRHALFTMLLFLLACSGGWAQDLKKFPLDDAAGGLSAVIDPIVKVEGKGALKITIPGPSTLCLGEAEGLDVEDALLIYAARIKTDLAGAAYLELWVTVDGKPYFSRSLDRQVQGRAGWTAVRTPFRFEKGQRPEKALLNLVVTGKGTVWVDDIVLSKEPLPR